MTESKSFTDLEDEYGISAGDVHRLIETLNLEHKEVDSNHAFNPPERAASALGKLGNKQAVPHLIKALKREGWRLRWHSAQSLGWLDDKRAVPPLLEIVRNLDEKSDVRITAAIALGSIGDKSVVPSLIEIVNHTDDNEHVRRFALEAIWDLDGMNSFEVVLLCLNDPSPYVQDTAAYLLGESHDQRAIQPLLAALQNASNDTDVGLFIVEALTKFGTPELLEVVEKWLHENPRYKDLLGNYGE